MLSEKLLRCLICPVCAGRPLDLVADEIDQEVIIDANLGCPDCGRWYPVHNDIPRMMPPDLGSNLAAANERWENWCEAMHRYLRWREAAWDEPSEARTRHDAVREISTRLIDICELRVGSMEALEIGAGTGHLADALPDEACYIGVDPLPAGQSPSGQLPERVPRPKRSVGLIQAVGEDLPLSSECFDVVLVVDTLDQARSPDEMLSEARRVLRPNGAPGIAQALSTRQESGGIGGLLRSLHRSISGNQRPDFSDARLRQFREAEEVARLVDGHMDLRTVEEDLDHVLIRAVRS